MIEIPSAVDHLPLLRELGTDIPELYWNAMKNFVDSINAANNAFEIATEALREALEESHDD